MSIKANRFGNVYTFLVLLMLASVSPGLHTREGSGLVNAPFHVSRSSKSGQTLSC